MNYSLLIIDDITTENTTVDIEKLKKFHQELVDAGVISGQMLTVTVPARSNGGLPN